MPMFAVSILRGIKAVRPIDIRMVFRRLPLFVLLLLFALSGCGDPSTPPPAATASDPATAAEIDRLSKENVDATAARDGLTRLLARTTLATVDRLRALLARAAACERLEEWESARQDYDRVLNDAAATQTHTASALRGRAYIARVQERWAAALADYDAILALPALSADERAQILARRGIIYCVTRQGDKAAADFTTAQSIPNLSADTQFDIARLHAQSLVIGGNLDAGLAALADLLQRPGLSAERTVALRQERAQVYWSHGRLTEAVADFTAAIETPGSAPGLKAWLFLTRGLVHLDRGAVGSTEAITDFTAVLALPDVPLAVRTQALIERSLEYLGSGSYEKADADALTLLNTAGVSSDDKARVMGIQAGCRLAAQDVDAALARLTAALALPNLSAEMRNSTRLRRAQVHADAGHNAEARADCAAVVEDSAVDQGELVGALLLRAEIAQAGRDFAAAENDLLRILQLGDSLPSSARTAAHFRLAALYDERGMTEKALPHYTALIDNPHTALLDRLRARDERGSLFSQVGESEKALADYAAIVADPHAPPEFTRVAHFRRMLIFCQLRTFEPALKEVDLALDLATDPAQKTGLYFFRGRILSDLGRPKDAIIELRRYLALEPKDAEAEYLLARNLVIDGQRDEALKTYQAALADDKDAKALAGVPLEELKAVKKSHPDRAGDVDAVLKALGVVEEAREP